MASYYEASLRNQLKHFVSEGIWMEREMVNMEAASGLISTIIAKKIRLKRLELRAEVKKY